MAIVDFENTYPNKPSLQSEIDTAVLGGTTPEGFVEQSTTTEIDPYSQAAIDRFNAANQPITAIGGQGANLYPGAGHDINVGTYSGSIVGSNPIFVPGGNVAAVNPMLERQKALQLAAQQRAQAIKPFDYGDPMQLKDARFQEKFNDLYYKTANDMVSEAYDQFGQDAPTVLRDRTTPAGRKFVQSMANMEFIGKNMDQITDLMAKVQGGLEDGSLEFSDETMKAYDDYQGLMGSFDQGDVIAAQDYQDKYEKLKGAISIEAKMQESGFLDGIMGEKSGVVFNPDRGDFYQVGTKHVVDYDKAIEQVTDSLARSQMGDGIRRGIYTKDDIQKALESRLKKQVTKTGGIQQKTAATRGAELEQEIFADSYNTYTTEQPNVPAFFQYDPVTGKVKRDESGAPLTWKRNVLFDGQMSIKGKEKTVYERDEQGNIQVTKTRGIPLDNVRVLTSEGSRKIPGKSFAEIGEISKLDDGTIVQKSRIWIPTQTITEEQSETAAKVAAAKGLGVKPTSFDSYTPQDHMIVLQYADGKGTGARTEIKAIGLKGNKEAQEAYDAKFKRANEWKGESKSTTTPEGGTPEVDEWGVPIVK